MIKQATPLSSQELARYGRHFSLPEIGLAGQQQLKNASVLCVGAGGLGCPLLQYLAATGIGKLGIVDGDKVDISNLHRQILYSIDDIGDIKVEVAKRKLTQLNPHLEIAIYPEMLNESNALEIPSTYDIIADCTDNYTTRYLINDACASMNKPYVYASIYQFEGLCTVFPGNQGPCYRCLYESPPPTNLIPNCAEGGVIGILPGLLGTLQAMEAIKIILGIGKPLIGQLLRVDALNMQFQHLELKINPNCPICIHQKKFTALNRKFSSCQADTKECFMNEMTAHEVKNLQQQDEIFLLDVREPYEHEICNLGGYLIPLAQLQGRLSEIKTNKKIVAYCKMGGRSKQAVKILQDAGYDQVYSLHGGILEWIKVIDSTLPIY